MAISDHHSARVSRSRLPLCDDQHSKSHFTTAEGSTRVKKNTALYGIKTTKLLSEEMQTNDANKMRQGGAQGLQEGLRLEAGQRHELHAVKDAVAHQHRHAVDVEERQQRQHHLRFGPTQATPHPFGLGPMPAVRTYVI